ncbi:MAG: hypothetical protein EBU87_11820, partial [Betaproteobacteria bacterium]|nr:hypothetical protein [Betaproteobacteria bacterium]
MPQSSAAWVGRCFNRWFNRWFNRSFNVRAFLVHWRRGLGMIQSQLAHLFPGFSSHRLKHGGADLFWLSAGRGPALML